MRMAMMDALLISGKSFIKNNVRYYDLDTYNHRVNVNDKVRRF